MLDPTATAPVSSAISPQTLSSASLIDLLIAGGWVMVPLGLCSIAVIAIAIERFLWGPTRARVIPQETLAEITELIRAGRIDEIRGLCRANSSPLCRITLTIVENASKPRDVIVEAAQAAGKRETLRLQRYVGMLGTIATITPLLGLLGTVFGMIKTFEVIQTVGVGQAQALAGGISEALITTAAGLVIAIPALLLHRIFLGRAREMTTELQEIATGLLHRLPQTSP